MKYLLLFFLLPLKIFSQDITGVWTGSLYNDTTRQFIKYELAVSEYNGKFSGYSHTIFVIDSIENTGVKSVKIKRSGEEYFIEDDKLIYNNYPEPPAKGVKTFSNLILSENDSTVMLNGTWKTNQTKIFKKLTGKIFLQKEKDIRNTLIIPKLDSLGLVRTLSFYDVPQPKDLNNTNGQVALIQSKNEQTSEMTEDSKSMLQTKKNAVSEMAAEKPGATGKISNEVLTMKNSDDRVVSEKDGPTSAKISQVKDSTKNEFTKAQGEKTSRSKRNDANNDKKIESRGNKHDKVEITGLVPVEKKIQKNEIISTKVSTKKDSSIEKKKSKEKINEAGLNKSKDNLNAVVKTVSPPAAEIATRKIETIKSVDIKHDSLVLSLFDNGEIDGDTVSVLLNGKIIMPKQGLMSRAINKTIYLTPEMGDSIVLIMYAENLGSIPPNTGLLVIHDGEDIFEIRFSGDLQKNSAIILRRKKK